MNRRVAEPLPVRLAIGLLYFATSATLFNACANFDPSRPEVTHGTLGEEIYQVFCERMAADADPTDVTGLRWKPVCEGRVAPPEGAPPRLVTLHTHRARLVEALDRTLPEPMEDELAIFMEELLPFFDPPEERLPRQTRILADFLMRLSNNQEALDALERTGTREGYRPLRLALGVIRPSLAYPDFDRFAELALATISTGGIAEDEFTAIQRALALEMQTMTPTTRTPGEETTLALTRELLFSEDDLFATGTTIGAQWVLLRDNRGIAQPSVDTSTGALVAPFVDINRDGLAEIDALGRFVDAAGGRLSLPTPFQLENEVGVARDSAGRALRSNGTLYYQYFNGTRTMLAGLTAEMSPWLNPDDPIITQMARGLPAILGDGTSRTENFGAYDLSYNSYQTRNGSAFDLVYAASELMHRPQIEDLLEISERLLRDHESESAGLLYAADYLADRSDAYPDAALEADNALFDDVIVMLQRLARLGILDEVLEGFADPRSADLGRTFGSFMRYRDRITYNASAPNSAPVGFPLDEMVNASAADTADNESLFQRSVALIDGLNGVRVCNKEGARLSLRVFGFTLRYPFFGTAGECELIRIDNVDEAYARAVLDDYELELQDGFLDFLVDAASTIGLDPDDLLEESSGINGLTRRPTPQALNRLIFWGLDRDAGGNFNSEFAGQLFDPVVDRHGNPVIERYAGTIFAWEAPGFYSGLTPLLLALHQDGRMYDSEGYIFGDLIAALHHHWPSRAHPLSQRDDPSAPNYNAQSNGRAYEALLADGLLEGELVERVQALQSRIQAMELRPGIRALDILNEFVQELILPDRSPDLATRDGRTRANRGDGTGTVPMSPIYLLVDALDRIEADLDAAPERRAAWEQAETVLIDQFLGTRTLGSEFRFENQRARAILLATLPFARERVEAHRASGDLLEWSRNLTNDAEDLITSPLVSGGIRLLDAVNEDAEARGALIRLLSYLVDEASANDAFASTLYTLADTLMVLEDDSNIVPLVNALSETMAPNVSEVVLGIESDLNLQDSAVRDVIDLVQDIQRADTNNTMRVILQNVVQLPESGGEVTPLETILDVIAEVNRTMPNTGETLMSEDYRSLLSRSSEFLTDEDHGLERLNRLVQNRTCMPENGRACDSPGVTIDSTSTCYDRVRCTCNDDGSTPTWVCER